MHHINDTNCDRNYIPRPYACGQMTKCIVRCLLELELIWTYKCVCSSPLLWQLCGDLYSGLRAFESTQVLDYFI